MDSITEKDKSEVIKNAIANGESVMIEYLKAGASPKYYLLSSIFRINRNCISGRPIGSYNELTFRIDRILYIATYWTAIPLESDTKVNKTGLYLVACYGDNHIEHIFAHFHKGEIFHNPYYSNDIPAFYHYIPPYSPESNLWKKECTSGENIFIAAYKLREPYIFNDNDYENNIHDRSCWKWDVPSIPPDRIISYSEQKIPCREHELDGIHYSLLFSGTKDLKIRENVEVLAYQKCFLRFSNILPAFEH